MERKQHQYAHICVLRVTSIICVILFPELLTMHLKSSSEMCRLSEGQSAKAQVGVQGPCFPRLAPGGQPNSFRAGLHCPDLPPLPMVLWEHLTCSVKALCVIRIIF